MALPKLTPELCPKPPHPVLLRAQGPLPRTHPNVLVTRYFPDCALCLYASTPSSLPGQPRWAQHLALPAGFLPDADGWPPPGVTSTPEAVVSQVTHTL